MDLSGHGVDSKFLTYCKSRHVEDSRVPYIRLVWTRCEFKVPYYQFRHGVDSKIRASINLGTLWIQSSLLIISVDMV